MSHTLEALGDGAFRFVRPPGVSSRTLFEVLRDERDVVDVVITEGHVAIVFEPDAPPRALSRMLAALAAAKPRVVAVRPATRITVRYDGADLPEIAAATGLSIEEVIARHAARTYVVKMTGFLPGFAYLGDVDPRIAVPRRKTPRTSVPAGSVAVGGPYTGVYPFASPGGWSILGTALDFSPFALELDDEVRFEARA